MKNTLLIISVILISFNAFAQNDFIKIEMEFYLNNEQVNGVKYYLIKDDGDAYLLPNEQNKIVLKDTLTTEGIPLLAVIGKHNIVFPVYYYRQSNYIKIYSDNRIFGNKTKKNLGIRRCRYLLRKEYYIDIEGFDDIITVFKPEKEYVLID